MATGTKIKVPGSEDSSDLIKIVGTREGVDKARHQIQVISDEQVSLVTLLCMLIGSSLSLFMLLDYSGYYSL